MAHSKPIVAAISSGLGVALVLLAMHVQRDRFAFTTEQPSPDLLVHMQFAPPIPAPATIEPLANTLEPVTIEIEPLEVLPAESASPKRRAAPPPAGSVKPAPVPCNPEWRELESGPAGR